MSEKTIYLLLFVALLVLGYPVGCVLAKFGRALSRFVGVVGIIGFPTGYFFLIGTEDHRYRILCACCLCLQVASLVSSFKNKQPSKRRFVDLWVSREQR